MAHSTHPLLVLVAAAALAACQPADGVDDSSMGQATHEETEAMIRRMYDAFESGDMAVLDSVMAEDFVEHEELPGLPPGRAGVQEFIGMWRSAFPDFHVEVHRVLVDGDMAAAHATFHGTHQGEFMGLAPTGREIAVPTVDLIRFENGQAVEHWGVTNEAAMMRQLGLLPEEESAAQPAAAPADTTM